MSDIIESIASKFTSGNDVPVDSARITAQEWFALLAHIQRGAVPSADQLWNNDEVMALNAELGLTMNQIERLVRAAMLTAELAWCRSQQPS